MLDEIIDHSSADREIAGCWLPDELRGWPSIDEIDQAIVRRRAQRILLTGDVRGGSDSSARRFDEEAFHMQYLSALSETMRIKTHAHEFPPYFGRFDAALHEQMEGARSSIDPNQITFTTEHIGRGGFADVYKAHTSDGQQLALKLFRNGHQVTAADREAGYWMWLTRQIVENVRKHAGILSREPFLAPKVMPQPLVGRWYVQEYSAGVDLETAMDESPILIHDDQVMGVALRTYAAMLKQLHDDGLCFIDNNPGAIIVDGNRARICDYDIVSYEDDVRNPRHFARGISNVSYASREQLLLGCAPTRQSDIEGFMLMIDNMYNKFQYVSMFNEEEHKLAARVNSRSYPLQRLRHVPEGLRDVVRGSLNYPRDDSIKIDDVISAIEKTYLAAYTKEKYAHTQI